MSQALRRIQENVDRVRQSIAEAATRSGRDASDVLLVAVTKYVDVPVIEALLETGCRDLGESRPQQLWEKAAAIDAADVHWHMIGHLQRNKVRRTLPMVDLIHSGDNPRLLRAMNEISAEQHRVARVLLEVNISGDANKHGFAADELEPFLSELDKQSHLRVCGLMAMAGIDGDMEDARRDFQRLRQLRDRLQTNCPENIHLDELSMGMSGDFTVAIEEGATIVRVGSALFEGIDR